MSEPIKEVTKETKETKSFLLHIPAEEHQELKVWCAVNKIHMHLAILTLISGFNKGHKEPPAV